MNDGTGSRSYQYNQLSQLMSETRQFAGLSGTFTLSYEYNLAGALKAFTDHVGSRVDYMFNTAARLTAVNGSGTHSVSHYAFNIGYRASGAIKDFDYGNGAHQHLNYNSMLRNTSLTLSLGSTSSTWTFDYHADGKLQKVTDSNNPVFDRAFVTITWGVCRKPEQAVKRVAEQLRTGHSNKHITMMFGKIRSVSLIDCGRKLP
jgi:YD repeat-containing protein